MEKTTIQYTCKCGLARAEALYEDEPAARFLCFLQSPDGCKQEVRVTREGVEFEEA